MGRARSRVAQAFWTHAEGRLGGGEPVDL